MYSGSEENAAFIPSKAPIGIIADKAIKYVVSTKAVLGRKIANIEDTNKTNTGPAVDTMADSNSVILLNFFVSLTFSDCFAFVSSKPANLMFPIDTKVNINEIMIPIGIGFFSFEDGQTFLNQNLFAFQS